MQSYSTAQHELIEAIDQAVSALGAVDPLGDEDYARCVDIFESASDQRLSLIDWISAKTIAHIPADTASILSIGCGAGLFDEKIFQAAKSATGALHYLGIDPNQGALIAFQSRLSALASPQDRVETLAEPFGARPLAAHFDLILMIQSLYYFDDRPGAISAAIAQLHPGGQLIIAMAPDEALNVVANLIWQTQMDRDSWFSHNVREHFQTSNLDVDVVRLSSRLTLPRGFDLQDDATRDILNFIIQTDIGALPGPLAKQILAFLESCTIIDNGVTHLPHPVDLWRFIKPKAQPVGILDSAEIRKTTSR